MFDSRNVPLTPSLCSLTVTGLGPPHSPLRHQTPLVGPELGSIGQLRYPCLSASPF